jgi:tetratricopeptide (TPR) repeat protein
MMEQILIFLVLTALCFLISLRAAVLSERCETKGRIHPVLKKVSWNTFFKVITFWAGILALRKLIYYIPIDGMIQTKATVWWVEKKAPSYLFIFMFIALIMVLRGMIGRSKPAGKGGSKVYAYEIIVIFGPIAIIYLAPVLGIPGPDNFFLRIFSYITKLLLFLKVVCSGKYLGLFTSFLLAYYITKAHKIFKVPEGINEKTEKEKTFGKAVGVPLLLLIIGLYTYLTIPSGPTTWMNKLLTQLRNARLHQGESTFEDLLDAAYYMRDGVKKSRALGEIAIVIRQTGDNQRAKNILEQAANEILKLQDKTLHFNAFRYLAVILKQSGDNSSAIQMYQKTVEAVQWIKDSDQRVNSLKRIIWEIGLSYDTKWADPIYRKIALKIAKTGDIRWATTVAEKIAANETKDITLSEIQQKIEEK